MGGEKKEGRLVEPQVLYRWGEEMARKGKKAANFATGEMCLKKRGKDQKLSELIEDVYIKRKVKKREMSIRRKEKKRREKF